ncbi:MAG: hypothetical protein RLZZ166_781 [Pseudomonadota bacterium]|jgi:hypothetical protein
MKKALLTGVLGLATLTSSAIAASPVYIGIDYGSSKLENSTGTVANDLVGTLGGSVVVTQDSSIGVGRLFGGYLISESAAIELGYFKTNTASLRAAGVSGGNVAYTANLGFDVTGFDVSAVFRPFQESFLKGVQFRIGAHQSETSGSLVVTVSGTSATARVNNSGSGLLYGLGYQWDVSDTLFTRFNVNRYTSIAGESGADATIYSFGAGLRF